MKAVLLHAGVSALLVAGGIAGYHHWVQRPPLVVGIVDLSEVYRAKEAQFTQMLTSPGSEEERQQALLLARSFSQRLPTALDELPRECGCLVILRTAVAGSPNAIDLTPALRRKVNLP